jgi:hypothetical protein
MKESELIRALKDHFKLSIYRNPELDKYILDALYANNINIISIDDLFNCGFNLSSLNKYSSQPESVFHSYDIYYDTIIEDYALIKNDDHIRIIRLFFKEKYMTTFNRIIYFWMDKNKIERCIKNSISELEKNENTKSLKFIKKDIENQIQEIITIQQVYSSESNIFQNDKNLLDYIKDKGIKLMNSIS